MFSWCPKDVLRISRLSHGCAGWTIDIEPDMTWSCLIQAPLLQWQCTILPGRDLQRAMTFSQQPTSQSFQNMTKQSDIPWWFSVIFRCNNPCQTVDELVIPISSMNMNKWCRFKQLTTSKEKTCPQSATVVNLPVNLFKKDPNTLGNEMNIMNIINMMMMMMMMIVIMKEWVTHWSLLISIAGDQMSGFYLIVISLIWMCIIFIALYTLHHLKSLQSFGIESSILELLSVPPDPQIGHTFPDVLPDARLAPATPCWSLVKHLRVRVYNSG